MEWLCLALQLHWASHPPGVAGAAVLQCCSAAGCTCLQQDHSLWRPQDTHCVAQLSSYSFIVLHWSRKKT